MSLGYYRSQVTRVTKEEADLQKRIGEQLGKIARLTGDIGSIERSITKHTTALTLQSKRRQIESKQQELARAQDQLADLQKRRAGKLDELARYTGSVERAESQERKKLDAEAKKRRDEELRHAREVTRESERQRRLRDDLRRSQFVIDHAKLPVKIKVLFLAANPLDTISPHQPPLRLDEEARAIREKIRLSEHRDAVELVPWFAARTDDLLQGLNEHKPHVVHFSGHGADTGELLFQHEDGSTRLVSKAAIVATMKTVARTDNLHLVIFNACFSAGQAAAVVEHVDVAIGMNDPIGDEAARVFAAQFYSALGFGRSVQASFDQARAALLLAGIPEEDTPELYAGDGIDPDQIVFVRP
jgi:hypothetical protein